MRKIPEDLNSETEIAFVIAELYNTKSAKLPLNLKKKVDHRKKYCR